MIIIRNYTLIVAISVYVLLMPYQQIVHGTGEIEVTPVEPAEQMVATPKKEVKPVKKSKVTVTKEKQALAQKVANTFPEEPKVMVAIAIAESGLDPNKTGYNCRYTNEQGKSYVWACKVGDRANAISTDGNILQQNGIRGGGDIEKHLKDVRLIYDRQGKRAWTVYKTGKYKEFLPQAEQLLALN